MSGRRPWVLGGALTALVVVGALVAWLLVRSEPYVAPTPTGAARVADPGAAGQALRELQAAVAAGDDEAAAGLAPGSDAAARDLLTAVVTNAEALQVEEFTARYVDAVGAVDGEGRWRAAVDLTWRFAGFDDAPVREEVLVGFDAEDGGVAITSLGGGDRRTPLWLTGLLEVRRSERTLVLAATAGQADLAAQRAEAAVPVVQEVLPRWPGRLVVEVPATESGLDAALAAAPGTYDGIAAVSASVDGTLGPDAQLHVFLNPEVYGALDPVGAQVVMSHEATHVATEAPLTGGVPMWLLEGFADYVALRDVDLPLTTTAGQIITQVTRDGAPERLPGEAEFAQSAGHLGAAYESAWLACVVLAEAGSEDALVRLYDEVSRGQAFAARLEALFGLTEGQLTARWRQRLEQLAASTTDGA